MSGATARRTSSILARRCSARNAITRRFLSMPFSASVSATNRHARDHAGKGSIALVALRCNQISGVSTPDLPKMSGLMPGRPRGHRDKRRNGYDVHSVGPCCVEYGLASPHAKQWRFALSFKAKVRVYVRRSAVLSAVRALVALLTLV